MAKTNNGKVIMNIPESGANDGVKEHEVLFLNGRRIEVIKGEDVEVAPAIKDIYREARENFKKGNTQKKPLALEG